MLFNTPEFIFLFLPCAVVLHFTLARWSIDAALTGTAISSLVFYAWWNPPFVALPIASIALNLWIARLISTHKMWARELFVLGIIANLAVLGYFKYAGLVLSAIEGTKVPVPNVPLALSFTTFVQIAFLADVYKRRRAPDVRSYALFVLFFPHLIAGPIVRWGSLGRQLRDATRYRLNWDNVALGLVVFTFGLAKKVIIADPLAVHVAPVFDAAAQGEAVTATAAWFGVLAFTAQIYFDFSGYSDMAIGLGLMFNYRLPINFAAPLRSCSEYEMWRRWHITLSRFFRDFIYVPLGRGSPGPVRRALTLGVTMLLAGLWHGANWTFVAWGAMHAIALIINMLWRHFRGARRPFAGARLFGWLGTFTLFAASLAFFRAPDIETALRLLTDMAGFGHAQVPAGLALDRDVWGIENGYVSEQFVRTWFGSTWSAAGTLLTIAALSVALLVPDTMEIADYREGEAQSDWRRRVWTWRPTPLWFAVHATLFAIALNAMQRVSEFVYYQF